MAEALFIDALQKFRAISSILREHGPQSIFWILVSRCGLRFAGADRYSWGLGIRSERQFWDEYFRTGGLDWSDNYHERLDPDFPLQPRPMALLPPDIEVHILDVGAGPLTYLGKKAPGKRLHITSTDALADEYDRLLRKYDVKPIIRTQRLNAETLDKRFSANTFDLCVARNCLDHAYDPERAVLQAIEVVKKGRYVLLEHHPNEADTQNYSGLHKWNFDMSADGDFLIRSPSRVVNMTKKYADRCSISCELVREHGEDFLVTRIRKR